MDGYRITGNMQMYHATKDRAYLDTAAALIEPLLKDAGQEIPDTDLLSLFYLMEDTDSPIDMDRIKKAAKQGCTNICAMPFYTAYDTKCCGKEHYSSIERLFLEQTNWDGDKAASLADTIGQMSEEIFEYYKALTDLLKQVVTQMITKKDVELQELIAYGYAALKGYNLGVLQHEKYLEFGMTAWKTALEQGEDRNDGMQMKFRAQYLQLRK